MPVSHHVQGWPFRTSLIGAGVVDLDYWGEIKVVLLNHFADDFAVQASDQIAQLILERIKTPHVKKMATLDDTNHGAGGFGSTRVKPLVQSPHSKYKKGKKEKEFSIPSTRFTIAARTKLNQYGGQRGAGAFLFELVGPGIY